MEKTRREIIDEVCAKLKVRKYELLQLFNERMGVWKISTQTIYNWYRGVGAVDTRYLDYAMEIYQPDDWRYQMAHDLLEAERAKAGA